MTLGPGSIVRWKGQEWAVVKGPFPHPQIGDVVTIELRGDHDQHNAQFGSAHAWHKTVPVDVLEAYAEMFPEGLTMRLKEYYGAGAGIAPDTSGVRGQGSQRNFVPVELPKEWPYDEDDGEFGPMSDPAPFNAHGATGFDQAPDRGSGRGRPDVSGGPPTPSSAYEKTWSDMREAMGTPINTYGRVVPMDGMANSVGRDAGPVLDRDGNPVSDEYIPDDYKDMSGPNNMWGGAGTIPGASGGWANSPKLGDDQSVWQVPEEEKKMNDLKEFFDAKTPDAEPVSNPDQENGKDKSDEEIENDIDKIYGKENNPDFDPEAGGSDDEAGVVSLDGEPAGVISVGTSDDVPGSEMGIEPSAKNGEDAADFQLSIEPEAGQIPKLSQFMEPSDQLVGQIGTGTGMSPTPGGSARGLHGMMPGAKSLFPKQSAWDEIALQVGDAVINLKKNPGQNAPPMMGGMAEGYADWFDDQRYAPKPIFDRGQRGGRNRFCPKCEKYTVPDIEGSEEQICPGCRAGQGAR